MSYTSCTAEIRLVLRWLASAVLLADRPDKLEAFLARVDKLDGYVKRLEMAYQRALTCLSEESHSESAELNAEFDQAYELIDKIEGAAFVHSGKGSRELLTPKREIVNLSHLPTLNLTEFSGKLEEWVGFHNLFISLVDGRTDLSPSQKLCYLLSCLRGEARDLVQHLPLHNENYSIAIEILKSRYQNIRRLTDTHVSQILNLPVITRAVDLRVSLLNPLLVATNSLKNLKLPVDEWSYMLVHIVLTKLPVALRERFEHRFGGDSATYLPTFADLIVFLEDECRYQDNTEPVLPRSAAVDRQRNRPQLDLPRSGARPRHIHAVSTIDCSYCGRTGHLIVACQAFKELVTSSRRHFAQSRGLCYGCLGNHVYKDCANQRPCSYCRGRHLPLLCANRSGENPSHSGVRSPNAPGCPTGGGDVNFSAPVRTSPRRSRRLDRDRLPRSSGSSRGSADQVYAASDSGTNRHQPAADIPASSGDRGPSRSRAPARGRVYSN